MTNNFKEQHDLEQAQIQKDAAQLRDKEQLYNLYVRRRDLIACDAASAVILSYFNGVPLTQDKLDEALQNPELLKQLPRHQTDQDLRANLIQEIENLLQGSSPQSIQHTVANLRYLTTAEVAEKRDELKRRQAVRELPKDELKVMARGVEASRFMEVPMPYRNSRAALIDLANTDVAGFRSLVTRCGEQNINRILAGKN